MGLSEGVNVNEGTGKAHLNKLLGIKNAFDFIRSNASIESNISTWSVETGFCLIYN